MIKEKLTMMECDSLREVANIAAGNAATALSNILNKKINIVVPDAKFIDVEKVPQVVGGMETVTIGVHFGIEGTLGGSTLILFLEKTAYRLIDLLMGCKGTIKLDEMSESALKEVGNILIGSYFNAMADFLDMKITPTVPHICQDMAGAMLNQILAIQSQYSNKVLVSMTNFDVDGQRLESHLVVLFDAESMNKTIDTIHKKYGI